MRNLGSLILVFIILQLFLIYLTWTISTRLKSIAKILMAMEHIKIKLLDE